MRCPPSPTTEDVLIETWGFSLRHSLPSSWICLFDAWIKFKQNSFKWWFDGDLPWQKKHQLKKQIPQRFSSDFFLYPGRLRSLPFLTTGFPMCQDVFGLPTCLSLFTIQTFRSCTLQVATNALGASKAQNGEDFWMEGGTMGCPC